MSNLKANNPDASKKVKGHFESSESGAHDAGKPTQNREGDGFHCGRKIPKPEEVRVLPLLPDKKAVEIAEKQNTSSDGRINVQPTGKNHPTRVKP